MARFALQRFDATNMAIIIASIFAIWAALISPASANGGGSHGGSVHVRQGQSIQSAIHDADPGDQIFVESGTYAEQLTIEKDGISLIGHGATLIPPATPSSNLCSGLSGNFTEAGICVAGYNVTLLPYLGEHRRVQSVGRLVQDVSITGFKIQNFSGENIAVVGAKNAEITGNTVINGSQYGILSEGSVNSKITGNTVTSLGFLRFIGICMDDTSGVQTSGNEISGYFTGLCVQTPGADVRKNVVNDCCIGAFVDPGVKGAKVRHNHIKGTGAGCVEASFGIIGILVDGSLNTQVRGNTIEGITSGGANPFTAGIAVTDDTTRNPVAIASGNHIIKNTLRNNGLDLLEFTNGTANVFKNNKCSSSYPPGLCP